MRPGAPIARLSLESVQLALFAGSLAVPAPWPAARPAFAFVELFACPLNAAFARSRLLGVLDPADELVARQRRDVPPGIERSRVGDERLAQIYGQFMHHPTWHVLDAHRPIVFSARQGTTRAPKPPRISADRRPFALTRRHVATGRSTERLARRRRRRRVHPQVTEPVVVDDVQQLAVERERQVHEVTEVDGAVVAPLDSLDRALRDPRERGQLSLAEISEKPP